MNPSTLIPMRVRIYIETASLEWRCTWERVLSTVIDGRTIATSSVHLGEPRTTSEHRSRQRAPIAGLQRPGSPGGRRVEVRQGKGRRDRCRCAGEAAYRALFARAVRGRPGRRPD